MKASTRIQRSLRLTAVALLLAGVGVWFATGARIGWTQTSAVTMQRDEITGIDYPLRHPAFIAGVEIPLLGAAIAATLGGISALQRRMAARRT